MRLIDADKANEDAYDVLEIAAEYGYESQWAAVRDMQKVFTDAQTVDAVPVVRCRECKYFAVTKDNDLHLKVSGCYHLKKLGEEYPLVVQGDGYCSWGQRREEAGDG